MHLYGHFKKKNYEFSQFSSEKKQKNEFGLEFVLNF